MVYLSLQGKSVNVRARNNGKSQIFDMVNTATTNYLNRWNQVLCNFGPSKAQGLIRDDGLELVMYIQLNKTLGPQISTFSGSSPAVNKTLCFDR